MTAHNTSEAMDAAAPAQEGEDNGPGPSQRAVEIAVALLLLALSVLAIWDNWRIGAGWGDSGPMPGYFPLRLGVIIGVCGLAIGWHAWRHPADKVFASWTQLKRVSQLLLPLTAYIGLIGWLGIYVSSACFIAAFMVFAGRNRLWKGVAFGVVTNLVLFWVFEMQFKVPLPKGPLEAWLGF